jgi:hypothetical protein
MPRWKRNEPGSERLVEERASLAGSMGEKPLLPAALIGSHCPVGLNGWTKTVKPEDPTGSHR